MRVITLKTSVVLGVLGIGLCVPIAPVSAAAKSQKAGPFVHKTIAKPALVVTIENPPAHGRVIEKIDLAALGTPVRTPQVYIAGKPVEAQFVPEAVGATRGALVLELPPALVRSGKLKLRVQSGAPLVGASSVKAAYSFANPFYKMELDPTRGAGFPSKIVFVKSGREFSGFKWNDRLYDTARGSFALHDDKNATLEVVSDGPLCTVLRSRARYTNPAGQYAPSEPAATYDWYLWKKAPLVYVEAKFDQKTAVTWEQQHFLELHNDGKVFTRYVGDKTPQGETFKYNKTSQYFDQWGALLEGPAEKQDAIGMLGGASFAYDGDPEYSSYLHYAQPNPWHAGWAGTTRSMNAWLWIGGDKPLQTMPQITSQFQSRSKLTSMTLELETQILALRTGATKQTEKERAQSLWRAALAERAARLQQGNEAALYARGSLPTGVTLHWAGKLGLALRQLKSGVKLESVFDAKTGRELLGEEQLPLWEAEFKNSKEGTRKSDAAAGWNAVAVENVAGGLRLRWSAPAEASLSGASVVAQATADAKNSAWKWDFKIEKLPAGWQVGHAVFPQIALADEGKTTNVLFPRGPGEVQAYVAQRNFKYRSMYPFLDGTMQLMAVYHKGASPSGLYVGMHDPHAGYKEIEARGVSATHSVCISYDHVAPIPDKSGTGVTLDGQAVWQLMHGDWFDAAQIYKRWAQSNADWWPEVGAEGRSDTPLWLRKLAAWTLTFKPHTETDEVLVGNSKVRDYFGVPTAVHWYNWHQIPFDNDYPHFFPTREGFREGVAELQNKGVFVAPYVNGRLWDMEDKGDEDWEFTKRALPYTAKQEKDGALVPFVESYDTKKADGTPVRMAVMCIATKFWQDELAGTISRLFNEENVDAVYIDQIAAAQPALCVDPSHGHPLGGGHWWVQSYNEWLKQIRKTMPAGRALLTESNAEPYIKYTDGYLAWNWQRDGQVALFPAVYGGVVQTFGRAYRGGPDQTLALRMKCAQELVWGEQIGWANPNMILEEAAKPGGGEFMQYAVRLRAQLARYFYAGQMARAPHFKDAIPTVTADWQWSGVWPVTTDAVLTGAWEIPQEKKRLLIFSNVTDNAITARFDLRANMPQLPATAKIKPVVLEGFETQPPATAAAPTQPVLKHGETSLTFAPRTTVAWEISW
jgi:hypothetical protein